MKLTASRSQLFAEVTVSDDHELTAVVFHDKVEGTIVDGKSLEGSETNFRPRIDKAKLRDGKVEILSIVTDSGGNQTRVTETLKVR